MRCTILIICVAFNFSSTAGAQGLFYDTEPTGPTLKDSNGRNIGFTYRLPGTGALVPDSDPNLALNIAASGLDLRAQPGTDPDFLSMPAWPMVKSGYLTASFSNVNIAAGDELGVFGGLDFDNVFRFGVRGTGVNEFTFFSDFVTNGVPQELTLFEPIGTYPSTNFELMIGRGSLAPPGLWYGLAFGLEPSFPLAFPELFPWGNLPLLYTGVFFTGQSASTARLNDFSSNMIPEPSTYALAAIGVIGLLAFRRRKSK